MKKNQKTKLTLVVILLLLVSVIIISSTNKIIMHYIIEYNIKKIDVDSLSKYYQLFEVSNDYYEYNEKDFTDFLGNKNDRLKSQLISNGIKLNSIKESSLKNVFHGFYHIGPDGIDDNGKNIIIEEGSFANKNGDISIPLINFYDINKNFVYVIENNEILNLGRFNANSILAKSLNCKGKPKIKLDTLDYLIGSLKFKNNKVISSKNGEIEQNTMNILLKDPLVKNIVEKYEVVYIPFDYRTLDYFYCDDSNNTE